MEQPGSQVGRRGAHRSSGGRGHLLGVGAVPVDAVSLRGDEARRDAERRAQQTQQIHSLSDQWISQSISREGSRANSGGLNWCARAGKHNQSAFRFAASDAQSFSAVGFPPPVFQVASDSRSRDVCVFQRTWVPAPFVLMANRGSERNDCPRLQLSRFQAEKHKNNLLLSWSVRPYQERNNRKLIEQHNLIE